MSAFLAGTLFGAILMAGIAAAIFTRFQRPREIEEWEDPFLGHDPAPQPQPINRQLIRERTFQ